MTRSELEAILTRELHRIAPDIGMADVDRDGDLREEFDIDSMDFLTLVAALSKETGAEMPESDYGQMGSVNAMLDYLEG
ncbi:phosphopantetheine-binding protein [Zhengella mangrovi]|uniref:Phosphopantetheine-binding protein n=1 Tax=Zhengella mangrovi TaxID=1982044 RepID=A0A2G1QK97_9HYPH|nr:acyl carrier protein [Zhengella mangrovi]PHP65922.1 phosphopantetheine-binding protein [Zhengella mangrovi]